MLGREPVMCSVPSKEYEARCQRDMWNDLIHAINQFKIFNDELLTLHPDVPSKIRQLMLGTL